MNVVRVLIFVLATSFAGTAIAQDNINAVLSCGDATLTDEQVVKALDEQGWSLKADREVSTFYMYASAIEVAHRNSPENFENWGYDQLKAFVDENHRIWYQKSQIDTLQEAIADAKETLVPGSTNRLDADLVVFYQEGTDNSLEIIIGDPSIRICNFFVKPSSAIGQLHDRFELIEEKQIGNIPWSTEKGAQFNVSDLPVTFLASVYNRDHIALAWPDRVEQTVKIVAATPRTK